MSRPEKIQEIQKTYNLPGDFSSQLALFRHPHQQALFDEFSENTLSNYYLPFGVAPNFLINGKMYVVPMVTEESSVVAAASRAASFWAKNGGFKTTIHNTLKKGHIWFKWEGPERFFNNMPGELEEKLREAAAPLTANMEKRGGGIGTMVVISTEGENGIFQLQVNFETVDSMGANFINSCLEEMKEPLIKFLRHQSNLMHYGEPEIIMSILSNYAKDCLVTAHAECPIEALTPFAKEMPADDFAQKFKTAVDIALADTSRAVTHNKGIFNGTDAVIIATGNDFRAIEASGHAWAARDGQYRSLSQCTISNDGIFRMELTMPIALGTVGGLTRLHPLASLALEILQNPTARELMGIAAATGLANNFSAIASLVTTGIQHGHMKLHLTNLLKSLDATPDEKETAIQHFNNKIISARAVKDFLSELRKIS